MVITKTDLEFFKAELDRESGWVNMILTTSPGEIILEADEVLLTRGMSDVRWAWQRLRNKSETDQPEPEQPARLVAHTSEA